MVSPTPIITKPPPTRPASVEVPLETTVAPQGVHNWRTVIKQYSTWLFAVLAAIPDLLFHAATWVWHLLLNAPDGLYAAAAASGMLADSAMPESVVWFIRVFSVLGLLAKFIKQQKPA